MNVVLIAGGILSPDALPYLLQEKADIWVGVDGGARYFAQISRVPDCITGDFDSLTITEQEHFAAQGAKIIPTPDQNYTDMDKSIRYVLQQYNATYIRIYGATGGQTDHFISVLSALVKYQGKAIIKLVDEHGEVWLASDKEEIGGEALIGRMFSLIALGEVTGIITTGLQWPLTCETLVLGGRDGTRNLVMESIVTVQKQSGNLFLMLHHKKEK
jgi:thiamine pyrophosphokinase